MAKPNIVTKQKLIETAQACIVEKGIHKLTLQSVADGAGVTQGTVYYHFKSKDQLMMEIVNHMCESSWENIRAFSKSTGAQWIQHALESARDRSTKNLFYHRLFYSLMVTGLHHEKVRKQMADLLTYENDVLTKFIQSLLHTSSFHGVSVEVWSVLANALIDGIAIQSLMLNDLDTERIYQDLGYLIQKLIEDYTDK